MNLLESLESHAPLLTDGGMETTLIFLQGVDLPHFASFVLLNQPQERERLRAYYRSYLELAVKFQRGFLLESPTWRANPDWGFKLGYSEAELDAVNQLAIRELDTLRNEYSDRISPIVISGCLGPRSDGYTVGATMLPQKAARYHKQQIQSFKTAGADMCSAITMTYINEGLGIALAAQALHIPVVISFTVETDGKLPSGENLKDAIEQIDLQTDFFPLYYMINCAHPTHFEEIIAVSEPWVERIKGIRANASCKSHAELDEATELDRGDAPDLANHYKKLHRHLSSLIVMGGCCGTDEQHIEAICTSVFS